MPLRQSEASPPSNPHVAHLRSIRERLDPDQTKSLENLETLQMRLEVKPLNQELLGLDPAIPVPPEVRTAMQRKASFLLATPIVANLYGSVSDLVQASTSPLPETPRRLLTAQMTALRQVIAHNNADAVAAARRGQRFCALAVRPAAFSAFLEGQKSRLAEVVAACRTNGDPRYKALIQSLHGLGLAYLKHARFSPTGRPAGHTFEFDNRVFGNAPLTLILTHRPLSSSYLAHEGDGSCAAILIGVDDLRDPAVDPATGTFTSQMHCEGFELCDVPSRQAGTYLQKLFIELAHLEEKLYLYQRMNKDGTALTACANVTRCEDEYKGSVLLGDSIDAFDRNGPDEEGRSQRGVAFQTIDAIGVLAKTYQHNHGEPIVMDPDLARWIGSPGAFRDVTTLEHPATRTQLAAMPEIAHLLLQTGVFSEATAVDSPVAGAVKTAI